MLRQEPADLGRTLGITFRDDRDDLDELEYAGLHLRDGGQILLVRHRNAPKPGTEGYADANSDSAAVLQRFLDETGLPVDAVAWRPPEGARRTVMEVPTELVPAVRELIEKHGKSRLQSNESPAIVLGRGCRSADLKDVPLSWACRMTDKDAVSARILRCRELRPGTLEEVAMSALRQRMLEDMRLKGFQEHTRRCSIGCVQRFCDHYGVSPLKLGERQIRDCLLYLEREKGYSAASRTNYIAAKRGPLTPRLAEARFLERATEGLRKRAPCRSLLARTKASVLNRRTPNWTRRQDCQAKDVESSLDRHRRESIETIVRRA